MITSTFGWQKDYNEKCLVGEEGSQLEQLEGEKPPKAGDMF